MLSAPHFLSLLLLACISISPSSAADTLEQDVQASTLVQQGQSAPDFTCLDTTGKQHTLSALKGKVVLLYFFSTSNSASLTEMRYLQSEIYQKLHNKGDFQMLAMGRDHTHEELVKLSGERKLSFPFVADPKQEIYQRYFTKFVPRTVLVRRDGTIAYLASGYVYEKILELQAVLARELAFKAP
jgi:peroxiredoxin